MTTAKAPTCPSESGRILGPVLGAVNHLTELIVGCCFEKLSHRMCGVSRPEDFRTTEIRGLRTLRGP